MKLEVGFSRSGWSHRRRNGAVSLHPPSILSLVALGVSGLHAAPAPVPVATLISPADASLSRQTNVTFTCAATDPVGLLDATIYIGKEPQTVTLSGVSVCSDCRLLSDRPTVNQGEDSTLKVGGVPDANAVLRFPRLIGTGPGQVPRGTHVLGATLEVNCTNRGDPLRVYRLTEDWIEGEVTWNERRRGVPWSSPGADGPGSNTGAVLDGDLSELGLRPIDITRFVQEWSDGAPNFGILLTSTGPDGAYFGASEGAASPILTVTYQDPWPARQTRPLAGRNATATFTVALADLETHAWNCLVRNTSGEASWAPVDFRVTVDTQTPDAPAAVSPASGAAGQPLTVNLSAIVNDPNGDAMDVVFYGRQAVNDRDFTVIVLPDTQFYSESYPEIFTAQTRWIAANVAARNIVFVTHEGDVVNVWNDVLQWERANASMSILDGVVPYGLAPGNHDHPTTFYNLYFPYTRYEDQGWYGGHHGDANDNNFQFFSAGGQDFIVLHLDFCPGADVLAWADGVLKANPTRRAIITTHGFLGASGERGVHHCEDTQYMWDALVEPNPNVWFVLSGHVHFEFRRTDVANGHDVHQLLADYQTLANGGNGWLRIMKFVPADNKVYVETYSPWLDRYQEDANSRFALDYPMREFVELGRIDGAPSGSTASLAWSGLAAGTAYEWYVVVTDSRGRERQGPHWRFTTGSGAPSNTAPVAAGAVFATVAGEAVAITLNADDAEGTPLTYVVVQGPAHGALTGAAPRLTYSPAPGFAGADSFTFQAGDGQAFSNLASVSISVGPAAAAVVASDDFESGSLAGGSGWSEAWTAAGDASLSTARNPHSGTYHVRLRGAGGHLERVVDLSGAAGARLRFWAKVRDFEGADKAYVKVSPDGRSYAIVKIFSPAEDDDAHHFFDIDLAAFARSSRFHIAFDAEMSSAGDYFFVDDVEVVISSAPPGGATPGWSPNSRRTGPGWQSPWADLRR